MPSNTECKLKTTKMITELDMCKYMTQMNCHAVH